MSRLMFAKLSLYLVAIGFTATGLLYMFYGSPLPYHLEAMQVDWAEIPPQQQIVITAIQRGSASGFLVGGITIAMLTIFALDAGSGTWARWCILLVGMLETLPAIHSVYQIRTQTPGNPPLAVLLLFAALVILGVVGSAAAPVRRG